MLRMIKSYCEVHHVGRGLRQPNNVLAERRVMLLAVSNPANIPEDKVFG